MGRTTRKYQLVYHGRSLKDAERAGVKFWQNAPAETKAQAMLEFVNEQALLEGKSPNALRLLRTTAIIKFP